MDTVANVDEPFDPTTRSLELLITIGDNLSVPNQFNCDPL